MLIAPGKTLVCIRAVSCDCGDTHATKDGLYMCEAVAQAGFLHRAFFCRTEGCDGCLVFLKDKNHGLCACCFKPLDDGDTSLVKEEMANPYERIVELEELKRRHDFDKGPMKKPSRVLV